MDQPWTSGWLPRISAYNRRGIAQALQPPTLFDQGADQVRAAIVDAPSALNDSSICVSLQEAGTAYFIDTAAWRYGDSKTWLSPKWSSVSYAPSTPMAPKREWIVDYVKQDLGAQDACNPSAYLLPSWFLRDPEAAADVARWSMETAKTLLGRRLAIRPIVANIALPTLSPDLVSAHLEALSDDVSSIYVQVDRVRPRYEPADRLFQIARVLRLVGSSSGRPIVAGHMGGILTSMLALGIDAVESGPSDAEEFNSTKKVRDAIPKTTNDGHADHPAFGVRMYYPELAQTLSSRERAAIQAVRAARAQVVCRRECHRFRSGAETTAQAGLHSVVSRLEEARSVLAKPHTMRLDHATRLLTEAGRRIDSINASIREAELGVRVKRDHVDSQLLILERAAGARRRHLPA